jgi:hypothetical protein
MTLRNWSVRSTSPIVRTARLPVRTASLIMRSRHPSERAGEIGNKRREQDHDQPERAREALGR